MAQADAKSTPARLVQAASQRAKGNPAPTIATRRETASNRAGVNAVSKLLTAFSKEKLPVACAKADDAESEGPLVTSGPQAAGSQCVWNRSFIPAVPFGGCEPGPHREFEAASARCVRKRRGSLCRRGGATARSRSLCSFAGTPGPL